MANVSNCSRCGKVLLNNDICDCMFITMAKRTKKEDVTKVVMHELTCSDLQRIYKKKNADYGDSFGKGFKEYGMIMPVIRLEDKLNRIKSLIKNEAAVKDESLIDSLMDLANYSIMTIIELEGDKEND